MENYKFFNDPYKFSGKHARMVSELWSLNDYEHSYFKRLIDIYIVAAILGFRIDRKAKRDYAPVEQRTVFGEQMRPSIRRFGVHPADDAVIRAGRAGNP